MDTRDKEPKVTAPGVMLPDTGMVAPPPDFLDLADSTAGTAAAVLQTPLGEQKQPQKSPTPFQDSVRRLRRDRRAMISLGVIVLFVLLAIVGPVIYQHIGGVYHSEQNGPVPASLYHSYSHEELIRQDEGPSAQYWLGTDNLGRDILARLMQGMLISITVALLAGDFWGWIGPLLAGFTDLMFAFPGLLFVILLTGIFGPAADATLARVPVVGPNGNARLLLVSLALAFTIWPLMARYVRGQTLQLKEQQFIEAARTTGTSGPRIIVRHIVPNLFSIVLIASSLNISNTIIGEAGISLLGLGVQAPGSSLGLMIADATELLDTHPWELLVPTAALAAVVLAFSFLGDGLRDAFDPRAKD